MADNTTGLPVQTLTGQFVSTKIVDSGGANVAAVDASGRLSTNLGSIGGAAPSATNPLFVELSTGAAAYTLFGQTQATAPYSRISDGTTVAGVIAGTTALKTDLSSIAGTAPGATSFVPARLTDGAAYYTRYGQAVATAQFASITDGTLTATVRDTGSNDSLNVSIVDASGNQIVSFGGGTQYAGDAVASATPTGTIAMGLANAAAPSDVSANNDAVAQWMLRNGSAVTNLASGGTLITAGAKAMAASLPVVLPTDGVLADATHPGYARLTDGTTAYSKTGQTAGTAAYAQLSDQTNTVAVIAATSALKTDISSVAGTATVTGGIAGVQAIGGPVASDGVVSTNNPLILGARVSAAAQADVSADNDVNFLWALRNGSLVVNVAAGGTLWTNMGQAAASGQYVRITDGTNNASVIAATSALKTDLSSIAGTAPGATSYVPSRLTDGTAYYTKTGQTAGTASFAQLSDQTNVVNVVAATNALKTDLSSYLGSVVAVGNPIAVRLSDGAAFYAASSGAPTAPTFSTQTSSALGAGANVRLNHYVTSGKTGQLMGVDVASTVPLKVEVQTILTGTPTTRIVLFAPPFTGLMWRAPYKTFITRASADATSGFSVTVTNKDAATAADVYSTGYWDEV
ncbi:MAG: hypothetical protein ACOYB2_10520 [Limnohabitans sp.]